MTSMCESLFLSIVRLMTSAGRGFEAAAPTIAQMWFLNTLRVITNPQRHLAKSRRNSASESPSRAKESSRMRRSNTVLMPLIGRW
jgi:hypothetical protein